MSNKKKITTIKCEKCFEYSNYKKIYKDKIWRICGIGNTINSNTRSCHKFKGVNEKMNDINNYKEIMKKLKPFYEKYTNGPNAISTDGMSISLELATFIYYLCNTYKFKTLMDRGSGFSSFVLRLYAEEQDFNVEVYSIDDNREWLNKTKNFLKENNLSIKKMYMWNWFYGRYKNKIKFDFMLEDAKKKLRVETSNEFTSFMDKENGVILWDDAKPHNGLITNQAIKLNINKYDIKKYTIDKYGRYGVITTKRKLEEFEKI